jgi:hypothetical protein
MIESINFILYSIAALICAAYIYSTYKRSEFGIVVAFFEVQFFLGACVYPALFFLDVIVPGSEAREALKKGVPDLSVAFHVILICVGLYFGLAIGRKRRVSKSVYRFGQAIQKNDQVLFLFLVLFGIFFYSVYFVIVGPEVAIINAALVRQGLTDGLGEDARYLFIKNIASLGLLAGTILPHILLGGYKLKSLYVFLYIILVAFAYINSISRTLLVTGVIIPYLIYLRFKSGSLVTGPISLALLSIIGFFAIFYGKSFGDYISVVMGGGDAEINAYEASHGFVIGLLRNFEHNWFSIYAGVTHFMQNGPYIGWDVLLSPFGFIPSRIMEEFGFNGIHYSSVEDKMACINSGYYGFVECTIPTYYSAASAYILPLGGGLVTGVIRGYLFGVLESMWVHHRGITLSGVWVIRYAAGVIINIMTFVPATIAVTSFYLILLITYVTFKKISKFLFVSHMEKI